MINKKSKCSVCGHINEIEGKITENDWINPQRCQGKGCVKKFKLSKSKNYYYFFFKCD